MRHTAQPVSVVTISLSNGSAAHNHGATLSSFSSISLNPPLVAFSLRRPSRLANRLLADPNANFAVHVLSSRQAHLAKAFARQVKSSTTKPIDHRTPASFPVELFNELALHAIGRLDCQLVHQVDLAAFASTSESKDVQSSLFLARVDRISVSDEPGVPLLWHDRGYQTVNRGSLEET